MEQQHRRARSPPGLAVDSARFKRHRSRSRDESNGSSLRRGPLTGWLNRDIYQSLPTRPPPPPPLDLERGDEEPVGLGYDYCVQQQPSRRRYNVDAYHAEAFNLDQEVARSSKTLSDVGSRKALRKAAKRKKAGGSLTSSGDSSMEPIGLCGFLVQHWYLSWMFAFIPLGFIAYHMHLGPMAVFTLNFLAIVPQAWIMGKATEDCASSAGSIIGGLLNAWFGNIVEMLLCIAGLRQGELVVVRCTLVGSILSNLLLVTGCALLAGGLKYKIQQFSAIGASTTSSLLMLGSFCAGLPTMYARIAVNGEEEALTMSRLVSFFLIALYLQYMLFQLNTHTFLFADDGDDDGDMSPMAAGLTLGVCTVMCAFNSEYLISSISGVVSTWTISKEFIGIILLPIIGNAAEHYTSVVVALNNKMDLSLGCAVGSSCQMLLFVMPVTVLMGWVFGQPMSLDLHAFEVLILIISVIIVTGILQDGYSNWLEGSILFSAYCVIAIVFFFENPKLSDII